MAGTRLGNDIRSSKSKARNPNSGLESLRELLRGMADILVGNDIRSSKSKARNPNSGLESLLKLMKSVPRKDNLVFINILLEDDFDRWVVLELDKRVKDPEESFIAIINFMVNTTDYSSHFCQRICSHAEFKPLIRSLIARASPSEALEYGLEAIINNVTFNHDDFFFRENDVKVFLLGRWRASERTFLLLTLVKLSSDEEIIPYEDTIWTFVPEVVYLLVKCCKDDDFECDTSHLGEILRYIVTLCRSERAKKVLSENLGLLIYLMLILRDDRFQSFVEQVLGILGLFYSTEQVEQIDR